MDTVNGKSTSTGNFNHIVVDLLSEDDSIILRNSRKGIWYKSHGLKIYPITTTRNTDENLLIDDGHRSKERLNTKNYYNKNNLSRLNSKQSKITKCVPNPVKISKSRLKNQQIDSQISMSSDTIASMIRQAILDKSKSLLDNLATQLKGVDEKTKRSVLEKLELNERLIIIKAIYSGSNNKTKFIPKKPPNSQINKPKFSNQRLSSSLSRIHEKSSTPKYPFRKSFSFLEKDISGFETANPIKFETRDSDSTSSKILIKQIEELQKQNCELSKTVRDLISKNFKLEKQIEGSSRKEYIITELKTKVETLTQYHDSIIDNVYHAYRQITRNLKQLKFKPARSFSSSNLSINNFDGNVIDRNARSHSVDTFKNLDLTSNTKLRNHNSITSLNEFLSNRRMSLENELKITKENINKINKIILDDSINSAIHKKHILEKEFLHQNQLTLETMLKSMS